MTEAETFLNGITLIETDKNIRKILGTIEDFLATSMASQLNSLSYLNEGSTRRKLTRASDGGILEFVGCVAFLCGDLDQRLRDY